MTVCFAVVNRWHRTDPVRNVKRSAHIAPLEQVSWCPGKYYSDRGAFDPRKAKISHVSEGIGGIRFDHLVSIVKYCERFRMLEMKEAHEFE